MGPELRGFGDQILLLQLTLAQKLNFINVPLIVYINVNHKRQGWI